MRRMHAEQADGRAGLPIFVQQRPRLPKNLRVELRSVIERARSSDGREIGVAKLELNGARVDSLLPQPPADHLRQPGERRLQALRVSRIFVEGVLMADGFRVDMVADLAVEPSAGIHAPSLARQRQAPLSKAFQQKILFERGQIADLPNAA